jgi:hypothetical protein
VADIPAIGQPGCGSVIGRRGVLGAVIALPALAFASPAIACRAAAPKDRDAYTRTIDRMFAAWWRRDLVAFRRFFNSGNGQGDFDPTTIFAGHFSRPNEQWALGNVLFNGSAAVVQVVVPLPADPATGICGGMASGHLFAIDFYPGLRVPTVQNLAFVGQSVLAAEEWNMAQDERRV